MKNFLLATVLMLSAGCSAATDSPRYRGNYTFGHEVNTFCPAINSQCYWLGPETSPAVREQLKTLYEEKKPGLYKPVCMIIEGIIDQDTPRDGFAADYDGLITILTLEGDCDGSAAITPGDLNHRRWVLAERDGAPVDADAAPVVLDFGERLYLSGLDGCQQFSGFAALVRDEIVLDSLDFERSKCRSGDLATALFAHRYRWHVVLAGEDLVLQSDDMRLAFDRDDWR